ncbi:uncharacterized protein LOC110930317 [Helianthus annuus]|uniref:uncharacterized protein LOC110930317 n=1 Tax=Helianthus annuus TaxID=4232 RepID=UPI001652F149|nr:uncharacterized protein LOC110930317 [Helianthus annuus]
MHRISHNVVPHMMWLDARIMKLVRFFSQNTALISCRLGDGLWVSAKVCLLFISSTISPLTRVCSIVTIVESIELLTVSTTSIARNVEPTTQLILGYKSSFKLFASQTEETQSQPSSAIPFDPNQ